MDRLHHPENIAVTGARATGDEIILRRLQVDHPERTGRIHTSKAGVYGDAAAQNAAAQPTSVHFLKSLLPKEHL